MQIQVSGATIIPLKRIGDRPGNCHCKQLIINMLHLLTDAEGGNMSGHRLSFNVYAGLLESFEATLSFWRLTGDLESTSPTMLFEESE